MNDARTRLLILGLGNPLYGDDGLGIAAVALLSRRYHIPPGVEVVDGGTLGLALIPCLERAERAILVDAIAADAPAGSVVRLEGRDVPAALPHRLSPHEMGVADLLFGARFLEVAPERVVLLGLVPERLDFVVGRSDTVEAGLDELVGAVVDEARALGIDLEARPDHETSPLSVGRAHLLLGFDGL